jgi:Domain of unknown function (DUF4249)
MKRNYQIIFLSTLVASLLTACIQEVDLPIRIETPVLVVDGLITDEAAPQVVRLSYSGIYSGSNKINEDQAVSGARVIITDDRGGRTQLEPTFDDPGSYRSTGIQLVGQVGRTYTLTVELPNGDVYQSTPEKMAPAPAIEKIYSEFTEAGSGNQRFGYNVFLDTKDPKGEQNYYRWQANGFRQRQATGVRNPLSGILENVTCWEYFKRDNVDIETDADIDGNTIQKRNMVFSPAYVNTPILIEVSQYSLSREVYQFWRRMNDQLTRTGSIFDPLPSSVEGNVSLKNNPNQLALGYFGASSVSRKRLVIVDTNEQNKQRIEISAREFIRTGGCTNVFQGTTPFRPSGW